MKIKDKGFTLIELLAVIIILAIVLGIAVGGYQKYLVSSRNKSYNIAENSMKNSAMSAISDCLTGNGKNREFCENHEVPEDQYDYELIYLSELTNDDYINPIKDPYNTDKLCSEQSYVYMRNKSDTEVENNSDVEYKVCLICSNYKSKDCLDDIDLESEYNAYCKISYDEAGTIIYDGKWTDQDLYLTLTAEGDYKYGISYFLYKIGSGTENRIGTTDNKVTLPLTSTVDNQEITVTSQDGLGNKVTTTCGAKVKIDKTKIISAKLEGKLATKKTTIKSNDWASEDVLLTVTPNPKKIPSGYYYQWYKDGVKLGEETTNNTYTASTEGTYEVVVTNGLRNQTVTTNEFIVKFDRVAPTIKAIEETLKLKKQDYDFLDNVTYTFGIGGGTVTCNPATSQKKGTYQVTCTATGNNGLTDDDTFNVKHSYQATATKSTMNATCGQECLGESNYCCPAVAAKCPGTYAPGSGDCACNCNQTTCTPSAMCCSGETGEVCRCESGYTLSGKTCSKTVYTCPYGGNLSGTTCYY